MIAAISRLDALLFGVGAFVVLLASAAFCIVVGFVLAVSRQREPHPSSNIGIEPVLPLRRPRR